MVYNDTPFLLVRNCNSNTIGLPSEHDTFTLSKAHKSVSKHNTQAVCGHAYAVRWQAAPPEKNQKRESTSKGIPRNVRCTRKIMTSQRNTHTQRLDDIRAEQGREQALQYMHDMDLLIDTNILITLAGSNSLQRRTIADLTGQNKAFVCDTVFWEFMRNCNLEKFRERMEVLQKGKDLEFIREDADVRRMFPSLWLTYLCCLRNRPMRMVRNNIPDMWIAATAVQKKIDHILTTDHSGDYPPELFDDQEFYIGKNTTLHLKTFNRERARDYWIHAMHENITVSCEDFRQAHAS